MEKNVTWPRGQRLEWCCPQPRNTEDRQQTAEAGKRRGILLPRVLSGSAALLTPSFSDIFIIVWLSPFSYLNHLTIYSSMDHQTSVYWSFTTCVHARSVAQLCQTLCHPMDCSLPSSSVHGILQARILEWVAMSFSNRSAQPRDWTQVSWTADRFFTIWATWEVPLTVYLVLKH